ncbi:hypothetical protein ABW21_db0206189 [Orbilia brochopaga]|nr:hypothetical protein ABW21_db0206189 [Drechslerella brochopaga]
MRFTTIIVSAAGVAAAAAQQTVWVTQTVIGSNCFPSTRPAPITMAPPGVVPNINATTTSTTTTPTTSFTTLRSTSVIINIGINATSTTGAPPRSTAPIAIGGAGSVSPVSGIALAGVLAGIMAIVA